MLVGEEVPRVSVFAVILTHGAPLALAKVGAPLLPFDLLLSHLFQASLFSVHGSSSTVTLGRSCVRWYAGHSRWLGRTRHIARWQWSRCPDRRKRRKAHWVMGLIHFSSVRTSELTRFQTSTLPKTTSKWTNRYSR